MKNRQKKVVIGQGSMATTVDGTQIPKKVVLHEDLRLGRGENHLPSTEKLKPLFEILGNKEEPPGKGPTLLLPSANGHSLAWYLSVTLVLPYHTTRRPSNTQNMKACIKRV